MNLLETAKSYVNSGISVIPIYAEKKNPVIEWASFMTRTMTETEINEFFAGLNGQHGIAMICGDVSKGCEVLDFDNKIPNIDEVYKDFCNIPEIKDILLKYKPVIETTPHGGYHIIYRYETFLNRDGNRKLARVQDVETNKNLTFIETRGEGGYVACYPTQGYTLKYGDFNNIPVISLRERDLLVDTAKTFDAVIEETPEQIEKEEKVINQTLGIRAGDDFNQRADSADKIRELLIEEGFQFSHKKGDRERYTRPGKDRREGISVDFNGKCLYVFSSNVQGFEPDRAYGLFSIYANLKHNGDCKMAAKELGKLGYGKQAEVSVNDRPKNEKKEDDARFKKVQVMSGWEFVRKVVTEVKGQTKIEYKVNYEEYSRYLKRNGYCIAFFQGIQIFVHVIDNSIIEQVTPEQIKDFVMMGVEAQDNDEIKDLLKNQSRFLFAKDKYTNQVAINLNFYEATPDCDYIYYKNCALKITKDGYEMIDYKDFPYHIWKSHIKDREFTPLPEEDFLDTDKNVFLKLIYNVTNIKTKDGDDNSRMLALLSAIGHQLHTYHDPVIAKVPIFIDEKVSYDRDSANGRTCKTLLSGAIKHIRKQWSINGKSIDPSKTFWLSGIPLDTQNLIIDDLHLNFRLEKLFSAISLGYEVERKGENKVTLRMKTILTTNHVFKGDGESYEARTNYIEFSPHYSITVTPMSEFGMRFFDDWKGENEYHWNYYDNLMVYCLMFYLKNGLLEYKKINLNYKALLEATSPEFIDFIQEKEAEMLSHGIPKKDLFNEYQEVNESPKKGDFTPNKFVGYLRAYAKYKGYLSEKNDIIRKHTGNIDYAHYYPAGTIVPPQEETIQNDPTLF